MQELVDACLCTCEVVAIEPLGSGQSRWSIAEKAVAKEVTDNSKYDLRRLENLKNTPKTKIKRTLFCILTILVVHMDQKTKIPYNATTLLKLVSWMMDE